MTNSRKIVLLVEDNQILTENFTRILRANYEVHSAASAEGAILFADETLPNYIILDILLGEHSAFALLNELQSYPDTSKIPIIICSDIASNLQETNLRQFNVRKILDKSKMKPRDLLTEIKRLDHEK